MRLTGITGYCGGREVFLGFAPASVLHSLSFADVLDEQTGIGYQRRFNDQHSLDFRKYIQRPLSTTIPLTFNLRPRTDGAWRLLRGKNGTAVLVLDDSSSTILSQVDCQHRLGYLEGIETPLAFMVFLGLTDREEMEVFNTINGKAKGLSGSLLDYHDAKLAKDLAREKPELFIALRLNDDPKSPWHMRLDLGGKQVSGLARKASLRTMQKAVKRFLHETKISKANVEGAYSILLNFWKAITVLLPEAWENPRKYFLTKGIGVYALNSVAADLFKDAEKRATECTYSYLMSALSEFVGEFDWSSAGPLKGLGGESGVQKAVAMLRSRRRVTQLELISNG